MDNRLRTRFRIALLPLVLAALAGSSPPKKALAPSDVVARAPPSSWAPVPDDDLLVIDLDNRQRIVIALAPDFAPVHVANIRRLTRAGWFVGTTINRVQDNYVTQWGDVTEKKSLAAGVVARPPAEYERPARGLGFRPMGFRDAYAAQTGHARGWPVASDGRLAWLPHCYGMVGVGRNLAPDTGTGAELYAVIGHGPRHLDRNIAMAGRVLAGMEAFAALPRGTEALGVYRADAPRPAIVAARIAADIPAAERPRFELMRDDTIDFATWLAARANRKDAFFIRPAGAVDICNALPPVRAVPLK